MVEASNNRFSFLSFFRSFPPLCRHFPSRSSAPAFLLQHKIILVDMANESEPEKSLPHGLNTTEVAKTDDFVRGLHFWGIFSALCLLAFISALDVSVITTAFPTIIADIGGATEYVWIANCFIIASTVLQPLIGQLADVFGRPIPIIASTVLFAVGSGIAGGAYNVGVLITGRTIQGVGAGGVYVLIDIICCDLVPLRERGKYLGFMFSWSGVAAALGPPVGGALAQSNWRWVFWINIPICGAALATLLLFMRKLKTGNRTSAEQFGASRVKQLDWLGALIFTPSMVALLWGLITGGVEYPWSSWRVILPLVLGVVGWAAFHFQQHFLAERPSVPSRLFGNRTSAIAFALTFTSSIVVQAISYFLPVYFQAVQATTVLESGTYFLPFAMGSLVCAVVAGILLSKFGAYRPLHAAAFALSAIGFGLFTLLDSSTTKVAWAFFELIASAGSGMIMSVLLPAIMAGLPESDVASSSATYSFIRNFGMIWGVTIPGIIFNSVFDRNIGVISDKVLQSQLRGGAAYAFASQMHSLRGTLDSSLWSEIAEVYSESLRAIWWFGLGVSIVSFFLVGGERGLELRKDLDTEFGMDDEKNDMRR